MLKSVFRNAVLILTVDPLHWDWTAKAIMILSAVISAPPEYLLILSWSLKISADYPSHLSPKPLFCRFLGEDKLRRDELNLLTTWLSLSHNFFNFSFAKLSHRLLLFQEWSGFFFCRSFPNIPFSPDFILSNDIGLQDLFLWAMLLDALDCSFCSAIGLWIGTRCLSSQDASWLHPFLKRTSKFTTSVSVNLMDWIAIRSKSQNHFYGRLKNHRSFLWWHRHHHAKDLNLKILEFFLNWFFIKACLSTSNVPGRVLHVAPVRRIERSALIFLLPPLPQTHGCPAKGRHQEEDLQEELLVETHLDELAR